jgi:predicted metal-dependent hydrolase
MSSLPSAVPSGRRLSYLCNPRYPSFMFTLKRNSRSRTLRIAVHRDGTCVVTAPRFLSERRIRAFVASKADWIKEKQKAFEKLGPVPTKIDNVKGYKENKKKALALVQSRIDILNEAYDFPYKKISIRNQKTRWGSCSSTGTLSFNWKIVLLSPAEADYIIVHELCHLGQMNHSLKFWALVAHTCPNHKAIRKHLRSTAASRPLPLA